MTAAIRWVFRWQAHGMRFSTATFTTTSPTPGRRAIRAVSGPMDPPPTHWPILRASRFRPTAFLCSRGTAQTKPRELSTVGNRRIFTIEKIATNTYERGLEAEPPYNQPQTAGAI